MSKCMSLLPLIKIDMLFNSRALFYLPNSNLTSAVSIFAHESHCFPFTFLYFLLHVKEQELLFNLMYTWMHEQISEQIPGLLFSLFTTKKQTKHSKSNSMCNAGKEMCDKLSFIFFPPSYEHAINIFLSRLDDIEQPVPFLLQIIYILDFLVHLLSFCAENLFFSSSKYP